MLDQDATAAIRGRRYGADCSDMVTAFAHGSRDARRPREGRSTSRWPRVALSKLKELVVGLPAETLMGIEGRSKKDDERGINQDSLSFLSS